jgi:hypothetical protein
MSGRHFERAIPLAVLAATLSMAAMPASAGDAGAPASPALTAGATRLTIDGTTNVHDYTVSTSTIEVTHAEVASSAQAVTLDDLLKPGVLQVFDVSIPATTLRSPKGDLDKNMYKALKTDKFTAITFQFASIEPSGQAFTAKGILEIAGVQHDIAFDVNVARRPAGLAVSGKFPVLMTDYGIAPPKAMLGMLKTNPLVTVTFETVLALPVD